MCTEVGYACHNRTYNQQLTNKDVTSSVSFYWSLFCTPLCPLVLVHNLLPFVNQWLASKPQSNYSLPCLIGVSSKKERKKYEIIWPHFFMEILAQMCHFYSFSQTQWPQITQINPFTPSPSTFHHFWDHSTEFAIESHRSIRSIKFAIYTFSMAPSACCPHPYHVHNHYHITFSPTTTPLPHNVLGLFTSSTLSSGQFLALLGS